MDYKKGDVVLINYFGGKVGRIVEDTRTTFFEGTYRVVFGERSYGTFTQQEMKKYGVCKVSEFERLIYNV